MNRINQLLYPKLYLGKSNSTYAKYGCLSATVNMGYNYMFKKNVQPPEMVKILNYDLNGYLQWPSIEKLGLKLVKDIRKQSTPPYAAIKAAYDNPFQFAALEVNNGSHFVWLTGRWWPYLGYRIADPFGGKITYSNKRNYRITGVRVIEQI